MAVVGIQSVRYLAEHPGLSEEVKGMVKAADWQTFIIALVVLVGGGYAIISPSVTHDAQLAAAGFVGAVVTYFFANKITVSSAAATIAAQQGPQPGDVKP